MVYTCFRPQRCDRNTALWLAHVAVGGVWERFSMPNSATRGYMRLHAPAVKGHILALSQARAPRGEDVEIGGDIIVLLAPLSEK